MGCFNKCVTNTHGQKGGPLVSYIGTADHRVAVEWSSVRQHRAHLRDRQQSGRSWEDASEYNLINRPASSYYLETLTWVQKKNRTVNMKFRIGILLGRRRGKRSGRGSISQLGGTVTKVYFSDLLQSDRTRFYKLHSPLESEAFCFLLSPPQPIRSTLVPQPILYCQGQKPCTS